MIILRLKNQLMELNLANYTVRNCETHSTEKQARAEAERLKAEGRAQVWHVVVPTNDRPLLPREHFFSSTKGMRGYFAVELWVNDEEQDLGQFIEPWQSDDLSFKTKAQAQVRAMLLAAENELRFMS